MKAFFVGLAVGFGIGILLLPRSSSEHEQLLRERTRELQRSVPQTKERELQSTAIRDADRFTRPRRPEYVSRASARRAAIHPVTVLNMATEKELVSAGLEPELASRIISGRPYASLQDARNRDLLSVSTLDAIQQVAQSSEPGSMQPLA